MYDDTSGTPGETPGETHEELRPDPVLGAALRDVLANAPVDAVDWAALERRVADGAALPLRRRRHQQRQLRAQAPRWWELTAGWARTAIPLGAVAAAAAALLALTAPVASSTTTGTASDHAVFLGAVASTLEEREAANTLVGSSSGDWLLEASLGGTVPGMSQQQIEVAP